MDFSPLSKFSKSQIAFFTVKGFLSVVGVSFGILIHNLFPIIITLFLFCGTPKSFAEIKFKVVLYHNFLKSFKILSEKDFQFSVFILINHATFSKTNHSGLIILMKFI